eukprot:CAMPEP_0170506414 /NCGR_PEP_ID=MMETSP0208-20121228/54830_1 /TAXON_ID=197538 /ORGANISM="Strombidium inclinatum, Strain S3" /LENGTH=75 /DNA_ID=CAMNT_0010787931 /DNA_START=416 /DNA_END=640 /DNA_ORIENTATION=-
MWIFREHLAFTKGEVKMESDGSISGRPDVVKSEILFEHEGIMKLEFPRDQNDYLKMTTLGDEDNSILVEVPRGEW